MGKVYDCYWLVDSRSHFLAFDFFNTFLGSYSELTDEYVIPEFSSNPIEIFSELEKLLLFLEGNPNEDYSVYVKNMDDRSILKTGMLFYTNDGKLILGASISAESIDDTHLADYYHKIKKYLNTLYGCITFEEAPPENSIEFIQFVEERYIPKQR